MKGRIGAHCDNKKGGTFDYYSANVYWVYCIVFVEEVEI